MQKPWLILEFALLFLALPLGLSYLPWKLPPLPVLWAAMAYCLFVLLRDPGFDRSHLWNTAPLSASLAHILLLFGVAALAISLGVYFLAPQLLFSLVRTSPGFWALVIILYPVLSVYPQGLIYRAFLMHRYAALFSSPWLLVVASAVAFSWMHILFRNPLAMGLSLLGGALFAWRYRQTGSLFVCSLEHALYGCFLFTIGLGRYFYTRAI